MQNLSMQQKVYIFYLQHNYFFINQVKQRLQYNNYNNMLNYYMTPM